MYTAVIATVAFLARVTDHNFQIPSTTDRSKVTEQFDAEKIREQFENELRREADLIRLEINEKFQTGDFSSSITGSAKPQNTPLPGKIQNTDNH